MSEGLLYDAALTLVPEAEKTLLEYDHPHKAELLGTSNQLRLLIASAYERLRTTTLPPEVRRFREVMRYGFLSLKRMFAEGDWRAHVLFTELLAELEPFKYLLEWLLRAPVLPPRPTIVELNSVVPLFSAKLGAKLGAEVILMQEKGLADVSVVGEVAEEYFRRYDVQGRVVKLDELSRPSLPRGTADLVFLGSLDAWKAGWKTVLTTTTAILKPRGYVAYLLPGNFREGLRTLLKFWQIPQYPEPAQVAEALRKAGFRNVLVNTQGCFYALFAQGRPPFFT